MGVAAKVRAKLRRTPPSEARGWGKGWPTDRSDDMRRVEAGGIVLFVHWRLVELVTLLITETERIGYDLKAGQCWGYAHRPIRGKRAPSNHSWGLAIDQNAPSNPMGRPLRTNIPPDVRDLWRRYGFEWGGDWKTRPDAMHFEFVGTPADADRLTALARAELPHVRPATPAPAPGAPPAIPIPALEEDDMPGPIYQQLGGNGQAVLAVGGNLRPLDAQDLRLWEERLRTRKEVVIQAEWDRIRKQFDNGDRFPWKKA